jgi:hypothetical protein
MTDANSVVTQVIPCQDEAESEWKARVFSDLGRNAFAYSTRHHTPEFRVGERLPSVEKPQTKKAKDAA